jgi:GNAT superfamily N-acetyltransferase
VTRAGVRVRRAREADSTELTAVAHEAKSHWGYAPEQIVAWRDDLTVSAASIARWPTFVAELDGRIAGFTQLSEAGGEIELEHMWVRPAAMGRGAGRALLDRATAHARAAGRATLHIDADPNAEAFYVACGAVRVGVLPAPIRGEPGRVRPQLTLATGDPGGAGQGDVGATSQSRSSDARSRPGGRSRT